MSYRIFFVAKNVQILHSAAFTGGKRKLLNVAKG